MRSCLWPDSSDDHIAELEEYFAGRSTDIVEALVLEQQDGSLSGFIELNIRNFAEGSRAPTLPYVEAWFVREEFRGRGQGRALMRQAEEWAVARGYSELASDAELDNQNGIAAHEALGFVETQRVVCFIKRLARSG